MMQEAQRLFELKFAPQVYSVERFCRRWSESFDVELICVTMGSAGCAIYSNDSLQTFAGYSVDVVDTVGAGDAFSAALLYGLDLGWPLRTNCIVRERIGRSDCKSRGRNSCVEFDGLSRIDEPSPESGLETAAGLNESRI